MCDRPTAATQKGLPFPHLSFAEASEREELVMAYLAGVNLEHGDYHRMLDLCRRTPAGSNCYSTCSEKPPGDAA